MTVGKAIELLSALDPNLMLVAIDGCEDWSEVETLEVTEVDIRNNLKMEKILACKACPW